MDSDNVLTWNELFDQLFDISARTSNLGGQGFPDDYEKEFIGSIRGDPQKALGRAKLLCHDVRDAGLDAECEFIEQVPDNELPEWSDAPRSLIRITITNEATATQ